MTETNRKSPLLLLSGLLCDHFVWEEISGLLDDIADVSIFSFAGYSSIPDMAASVLKSAPKQFALAGHSMGGRVALEVFRQAPQRVSHLALLNTGVHPRREAEVAVRQRLLDIAANNGMSAVADDWLPPMMSSVGRQNQALMQQLKQMVMRYSADELNGQIQALLNRPNAEEVLSLINVPTLLLSGTEDQWSPVAQHETMHLKLPRSQMIALEGAGHMSTVEAPEEVAGALRSWLTQ